MRSTRMILGISRYTTKLIAGCLTSLCFSVDLGGGIYDSRVLADRKVDPKDYWPPDTVGCFVWGETKYNNKCHATSSCESTWLSDRYGTGTGIGMYDVVASTGVPSWATSTEVPVSSILTINHKQKAQNLNGKLRSIQNVAPCSPTPRVWWDIYRASCCMYLRIQLTQLPSYY